MLWTFYMLAFIVSVQSGTDVMNEGFNTNGWTPITRDKVFNILDRKLINQEFAEDVYDTNQNNFVNEKSDYNEEILPEVTRPRYINYINNLNGRQSYSNNATETNKENYQNTILRNGNDREPKAISSNSIYAINNLASTNVNELMQKADYVSKDKLIEEASGHQYEVTERSEHGELLKQEVFKIHTNKQIDKFKETKGIHPENNKFTSKLVNILSNYNIKVNDVLPNYEISRNLKRNSPKQEYFLVPIPIRFSSKFNHFATDPMLMVFLTNYGYYLPNQFGRNRYSNLYGHLASNIHSKQLDSYKIYADTDSSQ